MHWKNFFAALILSTSCATLQPAYADSIEPASGTAVSQPVNTEASQPAIVETKPAVNPAANRSAPLATSAPAAQSGTFAWNAEYLYMMSSLDTPFFAGAASAGGIGKNYSTIQGWHSGYRLEGRYFGPNRESGLSLRWTQFPNFHNDRTVSVPVAANFSPTGASSIGGSASNSYRFYIAELLCNQQLLQRNAFNLSLQGGVQYACLNFFERVFLPGVPQRDCFWAKRNGIGPEIGIEMEYRFCNWLSLQARANGTLLFALKQSRWQEITATTFSNIRDDRYWLMMPAANMRVGINCQRALRHCSLNFGIGYEFLFYRKAIDRYTSYESLTSYADFGLQGPYVQLGISY